MPEGEPSRTRRRTPYSRGNPAASVSNAWLPSNGGAGGGYSAPRNPKIIRTVDQTDFKS